MNKCKCRCQSFAQHTFKSLLDVSSVCASAFMRLSDHGTKTDHKKERSVQSGSPRVHRYSRRNLGFPQAVKYTLHSDPNPHLYRFSQDLYNNL